MSSRPGSSARDMVGQASELQLVTFKLGDEEYGVNIMQVQEIIHLANVVKVPEAPPFVEGVVNLRSRILPVIDLRKRLGLPEEKRADTSRIIVADIKEAMVGLVVDSVSEVIKIPGNTVEPLPEILEKARCRFLKGIARVEERLIILLDLEMLLSHDEVKELEAVEAVTLEDETASRPPE